jgi:ATP-dependent exoDNAse (exonuclease V) alpha subunit
LIRGVGPKTASKIVRHFGADTLDVFDARIDRLLEVRGIARRKLETIGAAWREHQAIPPWLSRVARSAACTNIRILEFSNGRCTV